MQRIRPHSRSPFLRFSTRESNNGKKDTTMRKTVPTDNLKKDEKTQCKNASHCLESPWTSWISAVEVHKTRILCLSLTSAFMNGRLRCISSQHKSAIKIGTVKGMTVTAAIESPSDEHSQTPTFTCGPFARCVWTHQNKHPFMLHCAGYEA